MGIIKKFLLNTLKVDYVTLEVNVCFQFKK